jgi:hypothetical protein
VNGITGVAACARIARHTSRTTAVRQVHVEHDQVGRLTFERGRTCAAPGLEGR